MRKYEVIWERIKNADHEAWTTVSVADASRIQTIINMVMREKSQAHLARKALDLPAFGKLEIKRDPDNKRVSFRLRNSGANL